VRLLPCAAEHHDRQHRLRFGAPHLRACIILSTISCMSCLGSRASTPCTCIKVEMYVRCQLAGCLRHWCCRACCDRGGRALARVLRP
jgi:hypothetical protein